SEHFLPESNSRIRNETMFEFVFDTGVTIEIGNDQTQPLYSARLATELSTPWYRNVRPWAFELREILAQRGNVTITNNVINPTRGQRATLNYVLDDAGLVRINVFNVAGDLVDTIYSGRQEAGEHSTTWDGTNRQGRAVARGIYFIRVMSDGIDEYRKVMVVK
ncbi:MAG: FlgD immunoglobulin-like domain containing protein, partial [Spirochaetota bacterium]